MRQRYSLMLRDIRRVEQKLDNLLLYYDFVDNRHNLPVILLKDGSLLLLFELAGVDYEGLSEEDKAQMSYYLRSAIELLPAEGRGYMVANLFIRDYATIPPLRQNPDALPFLQYVQEQKQLFWDRQARSAFSNRLLVSVRYFDPGKPEPPWSALISEQKAFTFYKADLEAKVEKLQQAYLTFKSGFERFGFRLLDRSQAFRVLYHLVNFSTPPNYRPDLSLNAQIPQSDYHVVSSQGHIVINRHTYAGAVVTKYPPDATVALYLRRFYELDFPFILKHAFGFVDKRKMYSRQGSDKNIAQSLSAVNKSCAAYVLEVKDFQDRLESGKELPVWWHFTVHVLARNLDDLRDREQRIIQLLKEVGSAGEIEETNLKNCHVSMFPGHERFFLRKSLVATSNVGDMFSGFNLSLGDDCPTEYFKDRLGGVFAWSPFNSRLNAYHLAITGPTGSGKSFACQKLLLSSLVNNPRFYVIDLSQSFVQLFEFLSSEYPGETGIYTISRDRVDFRCNPFLLEDLQAPVPEHQMNYCMGLLKLFIGADLCTPNNEWVLRQCLEDFFKSYRILHRNRKVGSPPIPPLTILADIVEVDGQNKELANAIRLWTVGRKGQVFNSGEDSIRVARFCYFDIRDLESDEVLASTIIYTIFAKVHGDIGREDQARQEKYLFLDEAHRYLKNSEFSYWIELLFRVGRRYNLLAGVITQSLSDLVSDDAWSKGIIENLKQMLVFAGQKQIDDHLRRFGLSEYLIESYHKLNPSKREILYWSADGLRRILQPVVDPFTYWLATTDPAERSMRCRVRESCKNDMRQTLDICVQETGSLATVAERVSALEHYLSRRHNHNINLTVEVKERR